MQTNLLKLAQQVVRNRKVKEVAGDEPQNRDMLHREIIEAIPGQELRPGALKMQLRAGEEAALPLVVLYAHVSVSAQATLRSVLSMQHGADRLPGAADHADANFVARKLPLGLSWSSYECRICSRGA